MMRVIGLRKGAEGIIFVGQMCHDCAKKPLRYVANLKYANSAIYMRDIQMFYSHAKCFFYYEKKENTGNLRWRTCPFAVDQVTLVENSRSY
jgi:hypothetical protein